MNQQTEQMVTAQSVAYLQLASWIALMDENNKGRFEIENDDESVLYLSTAAADAFGFEEDATTPRLYLPKDNEEFFVFSPWLFARLRNNKELELCAGPAVDSKSRMRIVLPVAAEHAECLKSARFIMLTGVIDDNDERYERVVMLTEPVNDE